MLGREMKATKIAGVSRRQRIAGKMFRLSSILLLMITAAVVAPPAVLADGTWSSLGSGTDGIVWSLAADTSGTLYVGGQFTTAGGITTNRVAAWNGASWSKVGSAAGVNDTVRALALDASGNLFAGGFFTNVDGASINRVAKWDGSAWSNLGAGVDGAVFALAYDPTRNVLYVGGSFQNVGGNPALRIAKWDLTSNSWSALGDGFNNTVFALTVDSAGNLYAGGTFTLSGATTVNRLAKWDGNSWSTVGTGINGAVYALAADSSGSVYVGGDFSTAGGVPANRVARWDGNSWSALGSSPTDGVNAILRTLTVDTSGNVYAGGDFTSAGGVSTNRSALWDGSTWSTIGTGTNEYVSTLALDLNGSLFAGGNFSTAGGITSNFIARWMQTSSPVSDPSQWVVIQQALVLPDSGKCSDWAGEDMEFAYGSGVSGGWHRSWQPWVDPTLSHDGARTGGWACARTLVHDGSRWRTGAP